MKTIVSLRESLGFALVALVSQCIPLVAATPIPIPGQTSDSTFLEMRVGLPQFHKSWPDVHQPRQLDPFEGEARNHTPSPSAIGLGTASQDEIPAVVSTSFHANTEMELAGPSRQVEDDRPSKFHRKDPYPTSIRQAPAWYKGLKSEALSSYDAFLTQVINQTNLRHRSSKRRIFQALNDLAKVKIEAINVNSDSGKAEMQKLVKDYILNPMAYSKRKRGTTWAKLYSNVGEVEDYRRRLEDRYGEKVPKELYKAVNLKMRLKGMEGDQSSPNRRLDLGRHAENRGKSKVPAKQILDGEAGTSTSPVQMANNSAKGKMIYTGSTSKESATELGVGPMPL